MRQAINHEAGLVIRRTLSNKTWLEELPINLPDSTINLESIKKNSHLTSQSEHRTPYPTRIMYSELRGNEISVYVNKELKLATVILCCFQEIQISWKRLLTNKPINNLSPELNGLIYALHTSLLIIEFSNPSCLRLPINGSRFKPFSIECNS
jgi:hypothetical protein